MGTRNAAAEGRRRRDGDDDDDDDYGCGLPFGTVYIIRDTTIYGTNFRSISDNAIGGFFLYIFFIRAKTS